jgi:hypothetical protein
MKNESIELAFSEELKLREIWVADEKYATSEGIKVNASSTSLERISGLTSHPGKNGISYFQGDGITFMVKKGVITQIIVINNQ